MRGEGPNIWQQCTVNESICIFYIVYIYIFFFFFLSFFCFFFVNTTDEFLFTGCASVLKDRRYLARGNGQVMIEEQRRLL